MSEKHYIILVHGMGTHAPGQMKEQFISALTEAAKDGLTLDKFNLDGKDGFADLEVIEFNYSEVFDAQRKQWKEDASSIDLPDAAGNFVRRIISGEESLGDDGAFNTHWLDVIIYSFCAPVAEPLRIKLAHLIRQTVTLAGSNRITNRENVHVLGHSLGSAFVHDTITKMYESEDAVSEYPQYPLDEPLGGVWMMANVTRLMHTFTHFDDPQRSVVRRWPGGATKHFVNARNEFDPFTWLQRYDIAWPKGQMIASDVIKYWNTHDFSNYIKIPDVTANLLRKVCGYTEDFDSNLSAYKARYRAVTKEDPSFSYDDARELRENIINSTESMQSLKNLYRTLDDVYHIFKKFKEQYEEDNK